MLHAWWHDSLQLYFLILILFALSFLLVRGHEGGRGDQLAPQAIAVVET